MEPIMLSPELAVELGALILCLTTAYLLIKSARQTAELERLRKGQPQREPTRFRPPGLKLSNLSKLRSTLLRILRA